MRFRLGGCFIFRISFIVEGVCCARPACLRISIVIGMSQSRLNGVHLSRDSRLICSRGEIIIWVVVCWSRIVLGGVVEDGVLLYPSTLPLKRAQL